MRLRRGDLIAAAATSQRAARTMKVSKSILCLAVTALFAVGCTSEYAFRTVQICVHEQQDITDFKDMMRTVADIMDGRFIDASQKTRMHLEAIASRYPEFEHVEPVVHVGIVRGDGSGLSATNLGLHRFQIAIGFFYGRRMEDAEAFADGVVEFLSTKWQVEELPPDRGVLPVEQCGN